MEKHRALIVGAGRIGAGYNFGPWPYVYTHADAYLALKIRVELVGFVEPDRQRAEAALAKYGVGIYPDLEMALEDCEPDIVSVCTQPEKQADILDCIHDFAPFVKGVWCEKPWMGYKARCIEIPIQVNYIRRFDPAHRGFLCDELWVFGKKDIHTVCHFTDLARYWGVPKEGLKYFEMDGPCSYVARKLFVNPSPEPPFWSETFFPLGGVVGGFMQAALHNLLDAVEGKAELTSPPESAIESEKWANEILKGESA